MLQACHTRNATTATAVLLLGPTKLPFYEHPGDLPLLRQQGDRNVIMEIILAGCTHCTACKKEMFIENGKAKKMPIEPQKKTPKQVRSRTCPFFSHPTRGTRDCFRCG